MSRMVVTVEKLVVQIANQMKDTWWVCVGGWRIPGRKAKLRLRSPVGRDIQTNRKNCGEMGVLEKGLHYLVNILNFVEIPFTYFGV